MVTLFTGIPVGLGGGGAVFDPVISPRDPNLLFVACDLLGLYRSDNGGSSWNLLDGREVQGFGEPHGLGLPTYGFSVACHPTQNLILGFRPNQGLKTSTDNGIDWTLLPGQPAALSVLTDGDIVTAAAYDDGGRLAVGTRHGSAGRIYFFDGSNWLPAFSTGDHIVLRFVVVNEPSGKRLFFAATDANVLKYDDVARIWTSTGTPPGTLLGFAGASDTRDYILFATVFEGGVSRVYRYTGATASWSLAMGSDTAPSADQLGVRGKLRSGPDFYYEHLAMAIGDTRVVYVTGYQGNIQPPNVWASTDGGDSWTGIYDGYQEHPTKNLDAGYIEWDLDGWGFGGPAKGFAVGPHDTQNAVFTNLAAVHISRSNGVTADVPPNVAAVRWTQAYTQHVTPGAAGQGQQWESIGLETTVTWDYVVQDGAHFICYTDLGLARSTDFGRSWTSVAKARMSRGAQLTSVQRWGNCYQLARQANSNTMWAAVSQQANLPYVDSLTRDSHEGAVLRSDDLGATWYRVGNGAGLPSSFPVVSIVFGIPKGSVVPVLYAVSWGDPASPGAQGGVYASHDLGDSWNLVQAFPAGAYRLVFDEEGTLYLVGSLAGGKIYVMSPTDQAGNGGTFSDGPNLDQLLNNLVEGGARNFYPVDLTVRRVAPGKIDLYVGTRGVGSPAKVYKFDSMTSQWFDMMLPDSPQYAQFPNWFGVYFVDDLVYVTSIANGTWIAPRSQIEGVSPLRLSWQELGPQISRTSIPFLGTQRISQVPLALYITTYGAGVWRLA